MLRGLHKATTNWLGKSIMAVVLGLLTVSFLIWGIGDIFRGFGASAVAKVGGVEIGVEQFRQIYSDRLRMIGSQMQRPLTQDQARAFGLDRQILSQLIAETALDERAKQMRLGIENATVADRIRTDTNFQTPDGKFDRARFDQAIRNSGFANEARYVSEQRRLMLRQQILNTVSGNLPVPKVAVDLFERFENEQRAIDYVLLDAAQAGTIAAPSDAELTTYFDERKTLFRAPEYRKIFILALTPEAVAATVTVSDEEAAKFFEQRRARYVTPEKRELHQMMFPDEAAAKAAYERIQGGASFASIAAERELKPADIDLGTVTKAEVIDPAIAAAAFALKTGETSAPVKGRFGYALVKVGEIVPEKARDHAEVIAEIKKDVGVERARGQIAALRDKIEDARAGGETLEEAAKNLKLQGHMIDAVDRSGRAPDGQPVASQPAEVNVIPQAFNTQVGVENDAIQVEGGYVWYDLVGITPSRERALDEIKDQVVERWKNDHIAERLKAKAASIEEKVKAGASLADAASAEGAKVSNIFGLKRNRALPPIDASMLDKIFATPKGDVATAAGPGVDQLVFRVTDMTVPAVAEGSQEARQAADNLKQAYADDIVGQYVLRVQNDLGTTINPTAFNQVVGGGTTTN